MATEAYIRGDNLNATGDFEKITGKNILFTKIKNLFNISEGSHFYDPELGLSLYLYLFEDLNSTTVSLIEQYIRIKIEKYISGVAILNIESQFDNKSKVIIMRIDIKDLVYGGISSYELAANNATIINFKALD